MPYHFDQQFKLRKPPGKPKNFSNQESSSVRS